MQRGLYPPVDLGPFEAYGLSPRGAELLEYRRGEVIYPPGRKPGNLFLVDQGFVELYVMGEDGSASPVAIVPQGDPCGVERLLGEESHRCSALALTSCRLYVLPPESLGEALGSEIKAAQWVIRSLARRLRQTEELTAIRSNPRIRSRLLRLLCLFAREFGQAYPGGGILIPFPLTHEEVARLISVTRSTATRHLDELKRGGLIRAIKKRILLSDPDRLADEEPDCLRASGW